MGAQGQGREEITGPARHCGLTGPVEKGAQLLAMNN